ncbi:MAG: alpha/beta hydrolase [Deltaproteobacteria bacterium]|nr:alpha/beta hydrolase [Deltaproteobacteria bacterium]
MNISPIIFVPGIKGTTLSDHYPLDHQIVYNAATDKLVFNFDPVMLDEAGRFDRDLDRLIYEHEAISLVYGEMVSELRESLPLDDQKKEYAKVYVFPYDWRYPIALNARRLSQFVDLILAKTNAHPIYKDGGFRVKKVNIVAHSMGGCIAKHYATNLGAYDKVQKLVMLASPLRGSLDALKTLVMGETWFFDWFIRKGLRKLARTLPGVYDLLPFDGYSSQTGKIKWPKAALTRDDEPLDIFDASQWQANVVSQISAKVLKRHLGNTFAYYEKAADFPDPFREDVLMVYGKGENTFRHVTARGNGGSVELDFPTGDESPAIGDGVVPAVSTLTEGIHCVEVTKKKVGDWELDLGKVAGFHASFCAYDLIQDLVISFLQGRVIKTVRDRFGYHHVQDFPRFSLDRISQLDQED